MQKPHQFWKPKTEYGGQKSAEKSIGKSESQQELEYKAIDVIKNCAYICPENPVKIGKKFVKY